MGNTRISIRFFNDREVRAVWDEGNAKWWFSVMDIVGVLNDERDYPKIRNYWKYLKAKLNKAHSELVSATTQLKLRIILQLVFLDKISPTIIKRVILDSEGLTLCVLSRSHSVGTQDLLSAPAFRFKGYGPVPPW